jgi:hypothetical protein
LERIDVASLWQVVANTLFKRSIFLPVTEEVAGSSPVARAIFKSRS